MAKANECKTRIYVDADACPVVGIVEKLAGKWYINENIDRMLMERHLAKKARRDARKNHLKGTKKRSREDDEHFENSLDLLIHRVLSSKEI